jgi:hypothetical protein
MSFTRIQPKQIQLPTFLSPSGDISFTDNVTGVSANLSRSLNGAFDFTESVTIQSNEVITTNSTNSASNSNITIGGINNIVSGANNIVVNGQNNNAVSGDYNAILNADSINFGASGQNNTVIAGDTILFDDQITGSVVIADREASLNIDTSQSLYVSFASGINFEDGDIIHNGDAAYFNSHLHVDSAHSGIFSGQTYFAASSEFDGTVQFDGTTVFNGFNQFTSNVLLSDSSEAASQYWVNRIGSRFKVDNSYPSDLSGYLNTAYGNSFGTNSTGEVLNTGQPVTGLLLVDTAVTEAKLVFITDSFTGAIDFTQFQYVP